MKVITWNNDKPDDVTPEGVNPNTDEVIPEIRKVQANIATYLLTDDAIVDMGETQTAITENGQKIIISDVNNTNSLLYEDVNDYPDVEWHGYKYYYTSENGWVLNDDWVDPRVIDDEIIEE